MRGSRKDKEQGISLDVGMGLPTGFVREQPEVSLGKETLGLPESQKQCLVKNVALPAVCFSGRSTPAATRGWLLVRQGLGPLRPLL